MPDKPIPAAGKPHPVDLHVGSRIRLRRSYLGYSQARLAEALELTFQQIQKYEKGANRVSASRLHELSHLLDVPVAFFFEGADDLLPEGLGGAAPRTSTTTGEAPTVAPSHDVMARKDTLQLVTAYLRIENNEIRREILGLIKNLAEGNRQE